MAKKRKPVKKRELLNFNAAVILLAVIVIAVILKALLIPSPKLVMQDGQKSNLEDDAKILLNALTDRNEQVRLLESNELMGEKIMVLAGMDYNRVRAIVGVKNDFCIYFEDITGSILKVDGMGTGIGSGKIYINGQPCT